MTQNAREGHRSKSQTSRHKTSDAGPLTLAGWLGGWLGSWVAGWLGGWVVGWLGGLVAGWLGGWVGVRVGGELK